MKKSVKPEGTAAEATFDPTEGTLNIDINIASAEGANTDADTELRSIVKVAVREATAAMEARFGEESRAHEAELVVAQKAIEAAEERADAAEERAEQLERNAEYNTLFDRYAVPMEDREGLLGDFAGLTAERAEKILQRFNPRSTKGELPKTQVESDIPERTEGPNDDDPIEVERKGREFAESFFLKKN